MSKSLGYKYMVSQKYWRYFRPILLIFFILVLLSGETTAQQLTANQPSYTGLDILFLVDQSGSMGGSRYGGDRSYGEGNDALDLRFLGPQYALNWLSRYESTVVNNPPQIRYSLLTFGDVTRLLLDWTEVGVGANWQSSLNQILQDISSQRFGATNLGYTDFQRAMRETQRIFENAPVLPQDELHLNVVVLLTDGAPCVPTPDTPYPDCQNVSLQVSHLQTLSRFIQANLQNTLLYVIVLDQRDAFFPPLAGTWQQVVCGASVTPTDCAAKQLKQVKSEAELGSQFNFMLADVLGKLSSAGITQVIPFPPGTFTVPPFSQYFRLNLFKSDALPIGSVTLRRPDGTIETTAAVTGLDTPIETYEVLLPAAGTWMVEIPNVDPARIQSFVVSSDIIQAGAVALPVPNPVDMLSTTRFTVQIVDSAKVPLPYAGPPTPQLNVELLFYDAQDLQRNNRQRLFSQMLSLDDVNAPGINQYAGDVTFSSAGPHEARLSVYYTDPDTGLRQDLIYNETIFDEITVNEVYIDWHGLDPQNQRQSAPIHLRADIRRKADGSLLSDLGSLAFQITPLNPDGSASMAPSMYPNRSNVAGQVEADLLFPTTGTQKMRAELGQILADGNFQAFPVAEASRVFDFTIRPVTSLQIELTAPLASASEVQGPFPYFWQQQPITIRAELRDMAGNPLSLRDLTGGAEVVPTLRLTRDESPYQAEEAFQEVRPGVYELTTALPEGAYVIESEVLTPAKDFLGDYELATPLVSQTHQRVTAAFVVPTIVGGLAVILAIIALTTLFVRRELNRRVNERQNPLIGRLVIYVAEDGEDGPQTRILELGKKGKNRLHLSGSNLPGELSSLVITNFGDEANLRDGIVCIESYTYDKVENKTATTLFADGDEVLHVDYQRGLTINVRYETETRFSGATGLNLGNDDPF